MNHIDNISLSENPKKKARILIVDDDKMSRNLIKKLIESLGSFYELEIDEAYDGEEGYKKINAGLYDVVFLDYQMPIMNGIECLENISIENKPNVIMVTATDNNSAEGAAIIAKAYQNEVYNYTTKPISRDVTQIAKNAINDAIQRRELISSHAHEQETRERVDNILDGFLQEVQDTITSINERRFPFFDIAVFDKPYDRGAGDIFLSPNYREKHIVCFSLMDVSGHSLETSVHAQRIKAIRLGEMGHPVLYRSLTMQELTYALNDKIHRAFDRHSDDSKIYSTFVELRMNMETKELEIVNCGSEAPIVVRTNGTVETFCSNSMPLGMVNGDLFKILTTDFVYKTNFSRGDWIFLSSDGFVESIDEKGVKFSDLIPYIIKKNRHLSVTQMQQELCKYYIEHSGSDKFTDDITFAVLKIRDGYESNKVDLKNGVDSIDSQLFFLDKYLDLLGDSVNEIKKLLVHLLKDKFLDNNIFNFNSSINIETLILPETRGVEIIINLENISTENMLVEEIYDDIILSHIMKATESCNIINRGKTIVLNFVY